MSERTGGESAAVLEKPSEARAKDKPTLPKRQHYLINRSFQLRTVAELLVLCVCAMLLAVVTCTWALYFDVETDTDRSVQISTIMRHWLVILYVAGIVIVVYSGIALSHRTAGPMYRITQILDRIERGDLGARVKLREKDFWQEVASALNQAMDKVESRQGELEEVVAEMIAAARSTSAAGSDRKDLERAIEKATALVSKKDGPAA